MVFHGIRMVSGIGNRYTFAQYYKNNNNNILLRGLGGGFLGGD